MQITINTSKILGDEATIREEVIKEISCALLIDMRQQAQQALSDMLQANLREAVKEAVDKAVTLAIDTEFTDLDIYGHAGKTSTVRNRIADFVQQQCTFKSGGYSNDKNAFSRAVQEVTEKEITKFKSEFNSLVTKQVVEQSMDLAVKKLREALGIKV